MEPYCPLCGHELHNTHHVRMEPETGFILLDGQALKLEARTRQILWILIEKSPRVVTRGFIMDEVYGLENSDDEPDEKIVDVFICRARKEIKHSNYEILTIWGKGWLFRKKLPLSQELKVEEHNGREESQQLTG